MDYTRDQLIEFCEWHFGEAPPSDLSDEDIYYHLSGDGFDFPDAESDSEEEDEEHGENEEDAY